MPRPSSLLALLTTVEREHFFPGPLEAELRSVAGQFRLTDPLALAPGELAGLLAAADPEVLVAAWKTPALPEVLPPRLRYVCYVAGSVRHLVSRPQLERGLLLTNWGGSISRVVAEGALLHILAALRRLPRWTIAMHQQGAWKQGLTDAASLFGRRVGIHGFGRVARELVRLLQPFGCAIEVCAPDVDDESARAHGVARAASLESLFADNDVVVELAPLIPSTRGIVGEDLLRRIRPGGVFVNVGRGAVVDEPALVRVAREGQIQVGLDVYAQEPLLPDHPLRGLPNVGLTPHIAGPTADRYRDAGAFALRNLRAYAAGEPLEALVTPAVYDSST